MNRMSEFELGSRFTLKSDGKELKCKVVAMREDLSAVGIKIITDDDNKPTWISANCLFAAIQGRIEHERR
jgi:hypothetical protein